MMGTQRWPQYGTKQWRKVRARCLEGGPLCHWGCGKPASTADHVPSLEDFGSWHWNVVPACGPCNFGRRNRMTVPVVQSASRDW